MNERKGCLFLHQAHDETDAARQRHDWSALGAIVRAEALKALADQFLLHAQRVHTRPATTECSS